MKDKRCIWQEVLYTGGISSQTEAHMCVYLPFSTMTIGRRVIFVEEEYGNPKSHIGAIYGRVLGAEKDP